MTRRRFGEIGLLLGMTLMLFAGGCSHFPPAINVHLDNSLANGGALPLVEVHLMAVTADEYARWGSASITQYWSATGPSRMPNPYRFVAQLGPRNPSVTISKNDPIWERWTEAGRTNLLILADLGSVTNRDTPTDPRRASLPLDKKDKNYPSTITITVKRGGISIDPMP
jgi:hypothetical protein